jgi:hypothetical protein
MAQRDARRGAVMTRMIEAVGRGVLPLAVVAAVAALAACRKPEPTTRSMVVRIKAASGWQDTGVVVAGSAPFSLRVVSGQIHDGETQISDGGGSDYVCGRPDCCEPMPNVRRSAVIGRVGGELFDVSNGGFFEDLPGGILYLRVNDCDEGLYDNGGTLTIAFAPDDGTDRPHQ